jgi:predicted nucleic acid-binding protein
VIDHLHDVASTVNFLRQLVQGGDELCLCGVVVSEVYSGLLPTDALKTEQLVDSCRFLATTRDSARLAGGWRYSFGRQGIVLATTDVLIAATALEYQANLITANLSDFPMAEVRITPLPRARG